MDAEERALRDALAVLLFDKPPDVVKAKLSEVTEAYLIKVRAAEPGLSAADATAKCESYLHAILDRLQQLQGGSAGFDTGG